MRIDKLLANSGFGSRRDVKKLIKNQRVCVDKQIVTDSGFLVDETKDEITVDGKILSYKKNRYYMMNKPPGVLSATKDHNEKTVLDIMDADDARGVFPVGRLDKDTTGLLILTNDGDFSHQLLSPKKHVDKTYLVGLEKPVTMEDVKVFSEGFYVDKELTALPAKLEIIPDTDSKQAYVTIVEGKFHQVKRMFAARNNKVLALKRISMGQFVLDENLKEGEYKAIDIL